MLLQFTVSNFRSIRDEQVFSMAAWSGLAGAKSRFVHRTEVAGVPDILPVAAILGANGSGKSNLIYAFSCFRYIVSNSRMRNPGDKINVDFYRLSEKFKDIPTKFDIVFCYKGRKYEYGVSAVEDRILEEYLFAKDLFPGKRNKTIFEREWIAEKNEYDWYVNPSIKGKKDAWIESTHATASFLSTAFQLNSEYMRDPYTWIDTYIRSINAGSEGIMNPDNFEENKDAILSFVKMFDLDIESIDVSEYEADLSSAPEEIKKINELVSKISGGNIMRYDVNTTHITEEGNKVLFDIIDESTGTKSILYLSVPITESLKNGYCLFVDELNTSLHPYALQNIIKLFQDRRINKNRAQLIFTSHDSSVLSERLLERDQIWFVERLKNGPSTITPLTEFRPRREESLQRRYLSGRYGGVPMISSSGLDTYVQALLPFIEEGGRQGISGGGQTKTGFSKNSQKSRKTAPFS